MRHYEEMEEARQGRKRYERKRGKIYADLLVQLSSPHTIKNVIIRRAFGKYMVETTHLFDTLGNLIQYYRQKPGQLVQTVFMLLYPIRQQSWEYYHSDIHLGNVLGEGAFGLTKGGSDLCKAKIKEMMKEARLMRNFNASIHKNIVRIYGVAVDEQPLLLLLELVTGGALNRFLRENGAKTDVREKIIMCLGAGCGVEYLHLNQCMHRDLAARNCLITGERVILDGKCLRFPSSCPEKLRDFFTARVFAMVPSHRATMTEVVKVLKIFSGVQDDFSNLRRRKTNF
ncbi:hypothetical protein ANCDUO_05201 [Ancylostoma duodenale]|uniref:Protein kinase domain-containing protein n=1 Tax=Ancylostoma duodenale TaxID=51022 RepID=A0A0C2D4R6_9BILA|nr:hypothetical protein ANCDUO_05201 [Ancylostoma duodenale]